MGLFKLNEKKIDKLAQKGKIDRIADIFQNDSYRNNEGILEHAKNLLVKNSIKAVPIIEAKLESLDLSAIYWHNIQYFFKVLAELKEYDILNRFFLDFLRCNMYSFWDQKDKDIIYLIDILRERKRDSEYFQPFLWILYRGIIDPEGDNHKKIIPKNIDILNQESWKPSNTKENIILTLSEFMQDKKLQELGYLMQALGWKDNYDREDEYYDIKGAIYFYKKILKHLKKNNKDTEISFMEEYIQPIIKEILRKTVSISIHWSDIFADNLSYKSPECCAGCLSEEINHSGSYYLQNRDDGYNKDYINMKLPFCEKCKNLENEIIKADDGYIIFNNIIYGLLFTKSNKIETFLCTTREEYQSRILSEHLKKMGKNDMTKGIPDDQLSIDSQI